LVFIVGNFTATHFNQYEYIHQSLVKLVIKWILSDLIKLAVPFISKVNLRITHDLMVG